MIASSKEATKLRTIIAVSSIECPRVYRLRASTSYKQPFQPPPLRAIIALGGDLVERRVSGVNMRATGPVSCALRRLMAAVCLLCVVGGAFAAQSIVRDLPPDLGIPAAAQAGPGFDADKATHAYLGLLSPEQRRLSDQYFEGGYWLALWDALWTVAACVLLLVTGISGRMRRWSERLSRRKWVSTPVCIALILVALFLLDLPLSIYEDFLREHRYGLSEQAFGGWLRDQLVIAGTNVVIFALVLSLIYAAVRRAGSRWWIWATGLSFVALMFVQLIAPVYLLPLLNDYKPLPDGPVKEAVLSLARANQVPTSHVEWFDASKQTTRISANVAGLLNTTRIALNDNLLNKTSLPEIKAVLGHEMGHYVLNHVWKEPILFALVIGLAMVLLSAAMDAALARWGTRLNLTDRADPAGLPLAIALFSVIFLVLTPLQNLIVRSYEAEADAFGLNASREPYGWAMAAMRLSTYRKIEPGKLEEFLFYDHPSGYERVHAAMIWLRENQSTKPAAQINPGQK
jgi:STE24 endopeptidase